MKRLYLIALFALVCGGASAQENGNRMRKTASYAAPTKPTGSPTTSSSASPEV